MIGVILTIAIFLFTGFMAVMKGQKLFSLFLTIFAFSLTFEMVVSTYGQTSTTMAIALGAAVVAAILAQYAEKFAFFLLGVVAGVFLGYLLIPFVHGISGNLQLVAVIIFGVIFGAVTAHFHKIFIRIATAFIGGRILSIGALFTIFNMMHLTDFASSDILTSMKVTSMYMTTTFVNQYATYILAGAILCAVIGFFVRGKRH